MNGKTLPTGHPAKTFITLTTPDGNNRVWLSKSDRRGFVRAIFSFDLTEGRIRMADDIDRLPYVQVMEVNNPHREPSGLLLRFAEPHPGNLARLTDDLCELLEHYLPADDNALKTTPPNTAAHEDQ